MHLHPPPEGSELTADPDQPRGAKLLHRRRPPAWKRRLAWAGGTALLLGLLVVMPPLINANRYRGKIAESMSKSLGRPVHLDSVSLHLLPVPGFSLQNLVVSEDPAFGAEPTIRANTVEATLRVSSLWHRPVEFSTVRFIEPSVNLVRSADGRWNLSDVLLHASKVESAPTAQRHAGPAPRFPYIEATGARVNVKLGVEKLPYSLTEADFALWLPTAEQWRVRLVGHPARTDLDVTDPGRLRVEGELRRASSMNEVPVNFTASWRNVPLGEATRILAGKDWGWRGTLNLDATLAGPLGHAALASKLTLGGLRRAEFFPAQPLDLQVSCLSSMAVHPATLTGLRCTLPDDAPAPLTLTAETVHLQAPRSTELAVRGDEIPVRWALLGAALYSRRVPTDLQPTGTLDLALQHHAVPVSSPAGSGPARRGLSRKGRRLQPAVVSEPSLWTGSLLLHLPQASSESDAGTTLTNTLAWTVGPSPVRHGWPTLDLAPTAVVPGPGAQVTLSGHISQTGYSLSVAGSVAPAALLTPARYLPELGDGLETVLPFPPTGVAPLRVQATCSRTWSTAQLCSGSQAGSSRVSGPAEGLTGTAPSAAAVPAPSPVLAPPNLSPLEHAPFSTPRSEAQAPR